MGGTETMKQPKLWQCPCDPAVSCDMKDPCLGCEDYARWLDKRTTDDPIPHEAIEAACAVLRDAAAKGKYPPRGYVDRCHTMIGQLTYYSAQLRHEDRWMRGEVKDKDSGYHPLAHEAARVLARLQSIIQMGEPER